MFNQLRNVRKRWFVVAASVAVLSVGLVTGTVFGASLPAKIAGNGPTTGTPSRAVSNTFMFDQGNDYGDERGGYANHGAIMERVAEILEVEHDTLTAAFATAYDEQANTKFEEYVQGLVDDETLTEEQATEANDWFDERPDNTGPMAVHLARVSDSERVDAMLTKMVEREHMTQDEADAISDWHDDRPDHLPTQASHHSGRWNKQAAEEEPSDG